MKKKNKQRLNVALAIIVLIGGFVHLFQPLGYNLLLVFGKISGIVQFLAGAGAIGYALWRLTK